MTTPAQPSPDPPSEYEAPAARFFRGLLHWTPLLLALALFAQLCLLGLKPALAESERLDAAEGRLVERLEADEDRNQQLSDLRAALDDPIYRERLRLDRQESAAGGQK